MWKKALLKECQVNIHTANFIPNALQTFAVHRDPAQILGRIKALCGNTHPSIIYPESYWVLKGDETLGYVEQMSC